MAEEKDFTMIQRWLKGNNTAIGNDKKIFEDCQLGKISLQECKRTFLKNNEFPNLMETTMSDAYFADWLRSIGSVV